MKKLLQLRGKGKVRKTKAVEVRGLEEYGAMDIDSKAVLREIRGVQNKKEAVAA